MSLTLDRNGKLKLSEAAIQQACRELLEHQRAIVLRIPQGALRDKGGRWVTLSRKSEKGRPDLVALWPRRVLFVELKAKDGKLSAAQKAYHARLRADGFEVLTVRDVDDLRAELGA